MFATVKIIALMFVIIIAVFSSSCKKKSESVEEPEPASESTVSIPFPKSTDIKTQNKILYDELRTTLFADYIVKIVKDLDSSTQEGAWIVEYYETSDSISNEVKMKKHEVPFSKDLTETQRNKRLIDELRSVLFNTNIVKIEYRAEYSKGESAWIIYEIKP